MQSRTVIIGGGQAGLQCAQALRRFDYAGEIILISEEDGLPYQRPPLSKAYLAGDMTADRLVLKPEKALQRDQIKLVADRVIAIDRASAHVETQSGSQWSFDFCVLATGATLRRLPCPQPEPSPVHYIRTRADVDALKAILPQATHLTVIGGGFIGLEAAASLRKLGKAVTVVETADHLMGRALQPGLSTWFEALHRDRGVDLRLGASVTEIVARDHGLTVALADGAVDTDAVIAGVGVNPGVDLAADAGLTIDNGIKVDAQSRTSDPGIFAIGDAAYFPSARYGTHLRLESVQNAMDQAAIAAGAITGRDALYDPVPWFWSDQYDAKLQMVGLVLPHQRDSIETVRRQDDDGNKLADFHLLEGQLVACDTVSRPGDHLAAKKLIEQGKTPPVEALCDPNIKLKDYLN